MDQFEKICDGISLETLYGVSMAGSIKVKIGDFEFFGFDMGLGVDPFGADVLAFMFDLDLAFAVREKGCINIWFLI